MLRKLSHRRVRALSCAASALAAVGVAAIGPAPASASVIGGIGATLQGTVQSVTNPAACAADSSLSQPFSRWGDANEYRLLPGDNFADGAPGWSLSGGASTVSGGDPFALTGSASTSALSLRAGSTAISPFTCVDVTQPTFRFVDSGTPGSVVIVSVVYQSPLLGELAVPAGVLLPGESWQPSQTFLNGSAVAGLVNGGTDQMAVRFDAVSGTTKIDDVFVDPHSVF